MNEIDLTVAIVNYNTKKDLFRCLTTFIRHAQHFSYEIVVVDNNSTDGSQEMVRTAFPKVKLIANRKNVFATVGNNQVLKNARGRYSLIINPDISFTQNCVSKLLTFLDTHPQVAGVTPRLRLANGKIDKTCTRFLTPWYEILANCVGLKFLNQNAWVRSYRLSEWDRKNSRSVESITDIFLLIRTHVLKKINYYDEQLQLFFMEDDLSVRVHQMGYELWLLGRITAVHNKGASTRQSSPQTMYRLYESDMLYYYRKHFGLFWWAILFFLFQTNRIYYTLSK